MKRTFVALVAAIAFVVALPFVAAFEAHVINVTAQIDNALFVHPELLSFGTVFPQEYFETQFFISFSQAFSSATQTEHRGVDYVIKQKPQCVSEAGALVQVGEDETGAFVCPDGAAMRPFLCPYLSKHPDNSPSTGVNANNDTGLPAFHDPLTQYAYGKLVKFNPNGTTIGNDPADTWTIDMAVPCYKGMCAQDWPAFVHSHNPSADPAVYMADPVGQGQTFGCDLWVEVTSIF